MKFAYADPPYPTKSRKHYQGHADYADEVDHAALIERLEDEFDGWALSTGAESLVRILPLCPPPVSRGAAGGGVRYQIRLLSWCKPVSQPGGAGGALYGWEPVILRGWRREQSPHPPRDWFVCSPELYTFREKPDDHVTGAKPPDFCRWLFECAGLRADDEFVDLFRGSGAVGAAWEKFRTQPQLADAPEFDQLSIGVPER